MATTDEAERLKARGYDGLFWRGGSETCGCGVDDFRPCGQTQTGCRPARLDQDDGLFYPTWKRKPKAAREGAGQ